MIDPVPSRCAAERRSSPRWLAVIFPWLPVDRLRATRAHLFVGEAGAPVVVAERHGRSARVVARDRLAAAAGVSPGLGLDGARARAPGLLSFAHDPHADLDWLDGLVEGALRYGERVVAHPPDALLVEVSASTAAYGGERGLVADLEMRLAGRGLAVRHALGDNREIAMALARYAGAPAPDERGAVRRLPVAALDLDDDAAGALTAAGLKTVGDLLARPAAEVAARFGDEAGRAIRRLAGDAARDEPRAPVPPCHAERHLAASVATVGDLVDLFAVLATDLEATLAARGEVGRRWRARLFRVDGPVHRIALDAEGPAALVAALRRRVEPLARGDGYDLLRLEAVGTEAAARLLVPRPAGAESPAAPRPTRARAAPRRRMPDQAELPLACPPVERPLAPPAAPPQPIHLFDPPEAVDRVVVADGAPARFRWRRRTHEVARAEGPEKVAGDWWRPAAGDRGDRAYFRVDDRRGRRLWLFRVGDGAETAGRWYVHGLFA